MTERASLRGRLLARLLAPMLGLLVLSAGTAYYAAFRFANQVYDRTIEDTAIALSQLTHVTVGGVSVDLPVAAQHMLASDQRDRVYYAITLDNGGFVAGHRGLPAPLQLPAAGAAPVCSDAVYNGDPVRLAAYRPADIPVIVQVAETVTKRDVLAFEIIAGMLAPLLLLMVLGAAVIWIGVEQGLDPLTRIATQLRRRSADDLGPMDESQAPREVRPLVQALNGLLERVDAMLTAQRRFVADAAHQLRTPIAGLKTQAETALRASDAESMRSIVGNIVTAATRMSSLVVQLLSLARVDPSEAAKGASRHMDLEPLARSVTADWIARAIEQGIDLGYAAADGSHAVVGDPVMIRELIGNLIDNALKHCPEGSEATVSVESDSRNVRLMVTDSGPGIPPEERDRVFERFYRLPDSTAPGTGLGLSIAREIARMHGATISVTGNDSGRGTRVVVAFPKARPQGQSQDPGPLGKV